MMKEHAESVYNRTDIYDLFQDEEYDRSMVKHWKKIMEGTGIESVLDCSIGTGRTTLPLSELGIKITGSDLSREMLKKCRENAQAKELEITLQQSDFRELVQCFNQKFDCVMSTGNSLPHVPNDDLLRVLEQMDALVKEGGYLYLDTRNWEKMLRERQKFYLYDPVFRGEDRINLVQVWDYNPNNSMTFHLLYTFERENHIFQKEYFEEQYYPISQEKILDQLKQMGYQDIQVKCFPAYFEDVDMEKVSWYCIRAKKQ